MMTTAPQITEVLKSAIHSIRGWNANERRLMKCDTLAGIRAYVQIDLDEVRESLAPVEPAAPATSFEAIVDHLSIARLGLMQFGASDAQINFIARLAVQKGLAAEQICGTSGLTKNEASAIIDELNR